MQRTVRDVYPSTSRVQRLPDRAVRASSDFVNSPSTPCTSYHTLKAKVQCEVSKDVTRLAAARSRRQGPSGQAAHEAASPGRRAACGRKIGNTDRSVRTKIAAAGMQGLRMNVDLLLRHSVLTLKLNNC